MKHLLVDENLPRGLCSILELAGIEAKHVCDLGLAGSADSSIWQTALLMGSAIATKDSDFVDLAVIRREGQVVLFKVGNMRISELVSFAERSLDQIAEFLESSDQVLVLRA